MTEHKIAKNTICIWYDKDAEEAARFYASVFPDSAVHAVHRAPGDYPSGKAGDVLTVDFTVAGVRCIGLNGGDAFHHTEAFSFQIATDDQAETDRLWHAIVGNGGRESECGWCKDRWGISWQITPRVLTEALAAGGEEALRNRINAFAAMMTMQKIDVAAIVCALLILKLLVIGTRYQGVRRLFRQVKRLTGPERPRMLYLPKKENKMSRSHDTVTTGQFGPRAAAYVCERRARGRFRTPERRPRTGGGAGAGSSARAPPPMSQRRARGRRRSRAGGARWRSAPHALDLGLSPIASPPTRAK